jgi:CheY-like chemotaxis protein
MDNKPIYILLADDDEADRLLFTEAFEELKIKSVVHTVNDGVQLMEYLAKKDITLPHIIFLDLNMPRKNGLQCLKEIRNDKSFNDVFVSIYSTSSSEKDMEDTFYGGANVYIHKPNDFNTLKEVLHKAVMTAHLYRDPPFNKDNFLLRI